MAAALGFFLLPAFTALGVALWLPEAPILQLLGGIGGMARGMVLASAAARFNCRPTEERVDP